MHRLIKTLFLMGGLALMSACTTIYTGEITDLTASEQKDITTPNGDIVNTKVDVFARNTVHKRSGEDPRDIGVRYVSQITYTYPDGTVVRENIPTGDYIKKDNKITFRSVQKNGEVAVKKSGAATVEEALASAWSRANARLLSSATGRYLPSITPTSSIDAMLSAVDAVTN